jgi:chromosome segregation ATPase
MLTRGNTELMQSDRLAELVEENTQLKIDLLVMEDEVKRLQTALRMAERKDDNLLGGGDDDFLNENNELEEMYARNLEAKDAQIADMEDEIEELKNDNDLLKLNLDFMKTGMDNLNQQLHEKDLKLEFLDEAKECIRELTNKVNLLTEQKSSLEGKIASFRPDSETKERTTEYSSASKPDGVKLHRHDFWRY